MHRGGGAPSNGQAGGLPYVFRTSRGVFAACALLVAARDAEAQEALRSALSLDRIAQARQNTVATDLDATAAPHIGPVQAALGFYVSEQYNDNINYAQTGALADEISEVGCNSMFTWPATPQSSLYLNAGGSYVKYLNHSEYDRLELAPDSVLNWDVGLEDGSLSFFDQFSYSQQVVSQPSITGMASFPRFNNTLGTRGTWTPGKWVLSAGYSHNNFFSDSTTYQYLNRASEYIFTRVARRFAENTQAGLEASVSLTRYDLALQTDNTSYSGGGFVEWQVTKNLSLTARGGPTFYIFESSNGSTSASTLSSYYLTVEVSHNLTDFISHKVLVDRNVQLGNNLGSDYLQELNLEYSITWQLTQSLGVNTGVSYVNGSQPWLFRSQVLSEQYDQLRGSLNLGWRATKKIDATLSFYCWDRQSNMDGRNYVNNALTLRLGYRF